MGKQNFFFNYFVIFSLNIIKKGNTILIILGQNIYAFILLSFFSCYKGFFFILLYICKEFEFGLEDRINCDDWLWCGKD